MSEEEGRRDDGSLKEEEAFLFHSQSKIGRREGKRRLGDQEMNTPCGNGKKRG